MSSWSVAEAKARFSEVIDKALREGAQEVTRHGRRTAVVVSAAEWTGGAGARTAWSSSSTARRSRDRA